MDIKLPVETCRFCLTQDEPTSCLFERFDSGLDRDQLRRLVGMEILPTDEYKNICTNCETKFELVFSIMTEIQRANKVFSSLWEQTTLDEDMECNSTLKIELCSSDELELHSHKPRAHRGNRPGNDAVRRKESEEYDVLVGSLEGDNEEYTYEIAHEESIDEAPTTPEADRGEEDEHCFVCGSFSGTTYSVQGHLLDAHSDLMPYRCKSCPTTFDDVFNMNDHLRSHSFPYGCLYCVKLFPSEAELDEHRRECFGYYCRGCGQWFTFVTQLKCHRHCKWLTKKRMHVVHRFFTARDPSQPHKCVACEEEFSSNRELVQHLERIHPTTAIAQHPCDMCSEKFVSLAVARQHRASHKKDADSKHANEFLHERNMCVVCRKSFKLNRELLEHLESAHTEVAVKIHECSKCNRRFTSHTKLQKHDYNTHQGRQPTFFCSFCGRVFNKRIVLQDHENSHRGVKVYRCEECARDFKYKSTYDRHMQVVHVDTKKFTCQYCLKSFKRKPTLKVHLRLHTGEKPYQCDICHHQFVDPSSFHRHKRREHGAEIS